MSKQNNELESVLGGGTAGKDTAKDTAKEQKADKITMSFADLTALIKESVSAAVMQASETSAKVIAEALIEAKKPYVDPKQVENEKSMRESMRQVKERIDADIRASQDSCPHLQGSNALSDFQGQLTSIVQHRLDNGVIIGICTNCQRIFKPSDPDYRTNMIRKSGNRLSSAGQRFFLNPAAAAEATLK